MADIRALSVGNFTSVSSTSFFPVAVEDFQSAATVCSLDIVLIRGPDWLPILLPAHVHSLATSERDPKCQRLANSECGVFQLSDEASRFCEEQWLLLEAKVMVSKQKQT